MTNSIKLLKKITTVLLLTFASTAVFAAAGYSSGSGYDSNITTMATAITTQASAIVKLLSITAYVAGVGFSLAGVLQFKGHKENPQQVPLSKPVVMIIIAACLLYLPSILDIAGTSLFGSRAVSAATAGGMDPLSGL